MLLALLPSRRYFDRRASLLHETLTPGWITSIVLSFSARCGLACFRTSTSSMPTPCGGASPWPKTHPARFGYRGVPQLCSLPRELRACCVRPISGAHAGRRRTRSCGGIASESPRTSSYLALLADKSLLFNDSRTAFLMYAVEGAAGSRSAIPWERGTRPTNWPGAFANCAIDMPARPSSTRWRRRICRCTST